MIQPLRLKSYQRADVFLLMMTFIWGISFSLVKLALQDISTLLFLALRFWIAAFILLPFCFKSLRKQMNLTLLGNGSLVGLAMYLGIMFQTVGLRYTTASNSAFITGMAVVFVPGLVILIERRLPRITALIGAVFAVIGVYFLAQPQNGVFNKGDIFTFLCAISFAVEIVLVERLIKENQAMIMAFLMIFTTAVCATISALIMENMYIHLTANLIFGLIFVAVFCTALGFYMQAYWQPKTSATTAAVIYTMEPVFAAIIAMIFLSERFNSLGWLGAAFVFTGMMVSEIRKS